MITHSPILSFSISQNYDLNENESLLNEFSGFMLSKINWIWRNNKISSKKKCNKKLQISGTQMYIAFWTNLSKYSNSSYFGYNFKEIQLFVALYKLWISVNFEIKIF